MVRSAGPIPTQIAPWERYVGARVVVLGGTGFIGRWVARALSRCEAQVHLVVRDLRRAQRIVASYDITAEITEIDLADCESVAKSLASIRPHVTFNLAGYGVDRAERDRSSAFQMNARLVRCVARALAERRDADWGGQNLVHVGSALEYGVIAGDLAESSRPQPTTVYGRSKLAGTLLLRRHSLRHGLRALTARLFTVYGPGEHEGRLLPMLLEAAESGVALPLTAGHQRRDFTYVEDVAEGLLRLGLSQVEPGAIVNLATGKLTSVREFVETAANILQIRDAQLRFGALPTRPEEMEHSEVNITKLKALTGWSPPTSIIIGIEKTLAHRMRGRAEAS